MYQKAVELIKQFEGFKPEAYKCPAGIWTIGYGWTHGVKEGDSITKSEATELLQKEVYTIAEQIKKVLGDDAFNNLTENQVSALIDFVYNLGIGNFRSSTLCRYIKSGELEKAGDEFMKWNKAGGKVFEGLTRRREAERELWRE